MPVAARDQQLPATRIQAVHAPLISFLPNLGLATTRPEALATLNLRLKPALYAS
jgi:hypothetical protein